MATPVMLSLVTERPTLAISVYSRAVYLPSGADTLIAGADEGNTAPNITGATFNGTALSLVTQRNASTVTTAYFVLWSADLPASGSTYTLAISYSAAPSVQVNTLAYTLSNVSQGAVDAVSYRDIGGLDPVSDITLTPATAGGLAVQQILMIDARTVTAWSSGQSAITNTSCLAVATREVPTPASDMSMNFDLTLASARGSSFVFAFAPTPSSGAATTSTALRQGRRRRR